MVEPAAALVAHLLGGERLHAADAVGYGLSALGLAAGVALFASGRSGRGAPRPGELPVPPAGTDPPAGPLVRSRAAGVFGKRRR